LPKGASRTFVDPFADKQRPWKLYTTLAVVAILGGSWFYGKLDGFMPVESMKSTKVLGCSSPKLQKLYGSKDSCKKCSMFPSKEACDAAVQKVIDLKAMEAAPAPAPAPATP
jgi:hypothetical protein